MLQIINICILAVCGLAAAVFPLVFMHLHCKLWQCNFCSGSKQDTKWEETFLNLLGMFYMLGFVFYIIWIEKTFF